LNKIRWEKVLHQNSTCELPTVFKDWVQWRDKRTEHRSAHLPFPFISDVILQLRGKNLLFWEFLQKQWKWNFM